VALSTIDIRGHLSCHIKKCRHKEIKNGGKIKMIELEYSLIIEATEEPDFFGFYSPDLAGFTGIGHSIEDCLYKAKWGMIEHVNLLKEQRLPVPSKNPNPKIIIQNEEQVVAA
jgi:predicted RNase H-like HicB family nuclease